ncbi:MAG: type I DNA topoisomerase [Candidatus Omnitrophota bacterium]
MKKQSKTTKPKKTAKAAKTIKTAKAAKAVTTKPLVIVESPTKARTIGKILGSDYVIESTMGHIIDLPQKTMGIDIKDNFKPEYTVLAGRNKILSNLKKLAASAEKVYLATDPDREGEAISWHIGNYLNKKGKQSFLRVSFHEITPRALKEAFSKPQELDLNKVNAQQARRILDRLVGYLLSPLLWKKIVRGLSAGRVQSVALRLIVEREEEIEKFIPKEYWEIQAELSKKQGAKEKITAELKTIDAKKAEIQNEAEAQAIVQEIRGKKFFVAKVEEKKSKRYPTPPFITSTLQQEAFNKLRFTGQKTMIIAQQLYEGIELGELDAIGLITYMRTDSFNVSKVMLDEVRDYIVKTFGKDYLPSEPNFYKARKLAQEAHEAIRPTETQYTPEKIKEHLTSDQFKLYELIYRRFLASQMTPAEFSSTSVDIAADKFMFGASGSKMIFDGFLKVYDSTSELKVLPPLSVGEELELLELLPSQHFTKPPARYSDASLVKALEEDGIGRPSTYAPIIQTIIFRFYITREKGYFHPSELGRKVNAMLVEYFPEIMDVQFTAHMEDELDEVEEGHVEYHTILNEFYKPFNQRLVFAQEHIKKEVELSNETCDKCGRPMVFKWSRKGKFLSCSGYPECKNAKSITTGVKCPQAGCGGELILRRSRRGTFYGCSNYPKCTYIAKELPVAEAKSS